MAQEIYSDKLEILSVKINRLMGEKLGHYLIASELSNMKITSDTFNELRDYDLLLDNLKENFVPLLGEENTRWFLEELRTPRQGS